MRTTSTKYFYTKDHLGSVYELTSATGVVQVAYTYDAFGNRAKRGSYPGSLESDIGYTGHWVYINAAFKYNQII